MRSLGSGYQPTLLSASVLGIYGLYLLTFVGEIWPDLTYAERLLIHDALGVVVPTFGMNCLMLGLLYAFGKELPVKLVAIINATCSVATYGTILVSATRIGAFIHLSMGEQFRETWLMILFGNGFMILSAVFVIAVLATVALGRRKKRPR